MQASGIYHNGPQEKHLQHISTAECSVYFLWKGIPAGEMFGQVHYMDVRDVVSVHPKVTSVLSNVLCVTVDDVVYRNHLTEIGRKQMLQNEQNIMAFTKGPV